MLNINIKKIYYQLSKRKKQ